jgi:hypothetical protein
MNSLFLLSPIFIEYILPLLLVFTLVFAVLEKTQILGEEKRQVNAIIGFIIGVILIAFPYAKNIVVMLMPFLAVSATILFVFMLLYGFIVGKRGGDVLGKGWKISFGAILAIALVTFLLIVMDAWDYVYNLIFYEGRGYVWVNALLIIIIAGAIIAVLKGDSAK